MPAPDLTVRPAAVEDAAAILSVSLSAIRRGAANHYTDAQLEAWAGRRSVEGHRRILETTRTLVVIDDARQVHGFVSIALDATATLESGEVDQLFVHPDATGRGAARLLLTAAEDAARRSGIERLVTHASWRAVPVFERMGYEQVVTGTVDVGDEQLSRALMHKPLGPACG